MSNLENFRAARMPKIRIALAAASIAAGACFSGCGGSASTSTTTPPSTPTPVSTTAVQINMGDSPADWMLAFSMNISSMSMTGAAGSVPVVSASMPMEMMHLMGTMQPLAMISMPQGSYTGATIIMANATVAYVDPTTKGLMQKTISGPFTANVTFSSPITVGSTPMAVGFDFDLAQSITADSSGNLSCQPVFHVSSGLQGSGNSMDFMDGGIEGMMGMITSISGSSFTMSSMQAARSFTFLTNSSTAFMGGSLSAMSSGMTVMVDATLQADGSLMANRVFSMMNANGVMGGGIVTAMTGAPPTALTIVMQNGVGNGMMGSYFANGITVDLGSSTTLTLDHADVDLTGLPFTPTFDASHIYVGQNVMPVSSSGMMSGGMGGMMGGGTMAGSISATALYLVPQGLTGSAGSAVAPNSTSSFALTLPSDSAFASLTGAATVTVFQQPDTIVSGGASISAASSVHVFGLLFYDAGQWKLVSSRIGAN